MEEIKLQHLITLAERDAEMLKAELEGNEIPVIIRHQETGGYTSILMGFSSFNAELYTSEEDHEKAVEIMEELGFAQNGADNYAVEGATDKSFFSSLRSVAKIIILFYLLALLLSMLF